MAVILHRNDLRVSDNPAVNKPRTAQPIYIFDPVQWESPMFSPQRKQFVLESLTDLKRQYDEQNGDLAFFHGDTKEILSDLASQHDIIFNNDANHFRQGLEADLRDGYNGVEQGATQYSGRDTRTWSEQAMNWFTDEPITPETVFEEHVDGNTSLEAMRQRYGESTDKEHFGEGGRRAALQRLETFKHRIDHYAAHISPPAKAEQMTSHLSPYIRYGCISVREVYAAFKDLDGSNAEQFKDRLVWHQHFQQKLEDNPDLYEEAINPVYRGLNNDNHESHLIQAWKNGRTGYPLVDASMRALKQTGWMNFRMRAMTASFYSYILKQWWKTGADHFYKHLIDADVAINYYQWQMQSGLVGVHANRIYNPTKQVKDNDPNGIYIKRYVPELRNIPSDKIARPWRLTPEEQQRYGVILGEDYPNPIIDFDKEARTARAYFKRKAPEAYEAFNDDTVWEKASLSSRHSRDDIREKAKEKQPTLKEFSDSP